ncbi:hypothetical protein B0T24DRAFT_722772 [Lasiosphaeria ovina]|uniref:Aminoglycoside phosphotransferase domain-containing protein n=1 Tax=Lasiosphaeria ovina TaxID=92902 RepID=A0AAE0JYS0_9PEZI|nr:hypothetical protein B0T24DRAFT_722772 [Lasiosphaeria ovina]
MAGIALHNQLRTLKSAAREETDFLLAVRHQRDADGFRQRIARESKSIAAVVRHHLRLGNDDSCVVLPPEAWIQGGLNLCILVDVVHIPTINEKVACEVGAYAWMQEHCADIRIPHLYAFGFTSGTHFAHIHQRPCWDMCTPSASTAYMLLEHIGPKTGQMLSATLAQHRRDSPRQDRLFRGLARVMLSLARLPQPHIGSFRFNATDGTLYQSTDTFASDMLTMHDNYLLHYRHAVRNDMDARERMTNRTLLRAAMHHFIPPDRRNGPFLVQLTDIYQSNIFVDDDWNVLDLERICALPAEMLAVPYWLTGCTIDDIVGSEYESFDQARQQFLAAMEEEIKCTTRPVAHDIPIICTMQDSWSSKAVWFWACITSINGWLFVFEDHILPKFGADRRLIPNLSRASALWTEGIDAVVKAKVDDEDKYRGELRSLFALAGSPELQG